TPAQARAQLTVVDELVATSDNAAVLERRIEALREDQESFATDARELGAQLAPDLKSEPLTLAEALHERAAKARSARAARKQLVPRRRELAQQAAAAAPGGGESAGVGVDALDNLCALIDDRAALAEELDRIDVEIEAAGAAGVVKLAEVLHDATPEALAAARTADESESQRLEEHRSTLERTAGALREKLDAAGSDEAALAAEQEAHARAAIVDGLERYAELQLAAAALRAAIERHPRQHQGPP